ncbi:MAG TPA: hypothetical protein VNG12_11720 [Acidimicrobiales bacterium]|nr:hypothetical protein [Acidimicrobiales bacterium]
MADAPNGWAPDPYGRHGERYFSAGQPTRLVRDSGQEGYDDPMGSAPSPTAAPPAEARAPRSSEPAAPALGRAVSPSPTAETSEVYPPAQQNGAPGGTSAPTAPRVASGSLPKRRNRLVVAVATLVVVAAAAIIAITVVGAGKGQPSHPSTPAGQYLAAARTFNSSQTRLTNELSGLSTSDPTFLSKFDAAYRPEIAAIQRFGTTLAGIPFPKTVGARVRVERTQLRRLAAFDSTLVQEPTLTALKSHIIGLIALLRTLATATDDLRRSLGLPPVPNVGATPTTTTTPGSPTS